MGCRLNDFDLGEWTMIRSVEGHRVEVAPATTKPIVYRGKATNTPTLTGWVYKLDGKFQGFTAMDCDRERAIEAITWHVNRKLRGDEPCMLIRLTPTATSASVWLLGQ